MNRKANLVVILGISLFIASGHAEVPSKMSYQGKLTDEYGVPVSDGDYTIRFRIYTAPSGGELLWDEQQTVPVEDGLFSVLLGDVEVIPDTVFTGPTRYLALQVSPDPEMSERKAIVSVGYAFRALDADTADYALSAPGAPDNDWVIVGGVLHPAADYGLSMRQLNIMYGQHDSTHVNFGIACTTGTSGQNYKYCIVGGGQANAAGGPHSTVGGGYSNAANGQYATVSGGTANIASGDSSTVAGGSNNTASADAATVGGGAINFANAPRATVAGGAYNNATDFATAVGGGTFNVAAVFGATVSGGVGNLSSDSGATVGGGTYNRARGMYSVIAGGGGATTSDSNYAPGNWAAIGGGSENEASGYHSTVGGGYSNSARDSAATIGGGAHNRAWQNYAAIGGGKNNYAEEYATVGGGLQNNAGFYMATIGGGYNNLIQTGNTATIAGGSSNRANGSYATVGGGNINRAEGLNSTVGGGRADTASGHFSTIPGGRSNNASGDYSFAAGRKARAVHDGAFVWADSTDAGFASTAVNQFLIRASGGVGIGTNSPGSSALALVENAAGTIGRTVNFERTQDPSTDNDMLQIKVPSTAPADFQFIECERGTDVKFKVEGDGDVFADGTYTAPADFSEMIAVSLGASTVEPGDVMVIDPNNPRAVRKASTPRSTLVFGIYSAKPGFIGSKRDWDKPAGEEVGTYTLGEMAAKFNEVPVAVVGIAPCKVSAENGPIRPGDLLVTSSTPGHGMRDEKPNVGTVVGKALESLSSGTGVIEVLVMPQ